MSEDLWMAAFRLDLGVATQTSFRAFQNDFAEWAKNQPTPPFTLTNGWHTITPQIAEQLLLRNKQNRKVRLPEVVKRARDMVRGKWKKTGQPLIFDTDGGLYDGQHRLLACYLSGASFETYVVVDVVSEPDLFVFCDVGATRGAKDALQTAGYNGIAATIANVVRLTLHPRLALTGEKKIHIPEYEILEYVEGHEDICTVLADQLDFRKAATKLLLNKTVAGYVAWTISQVYGSEYQEFMDMLGSEEPFAADHPITHLRKACAALKSEKERGIGGEDRRMMAYAISAFNHLKTNTPVKREFKLPHNTWVSVVPPEAEQAAA